MRREDVELAQAKSSAKYGHANPLSQSALDVLFEQAWEDRSRCGSFTMRLLVGEICRLLAILRQHHIDPVSGWKKEPEEEP